MKAMILCSILMLGFQGLAQAESTGTAKKSAKPKSQFNSQVFEKEESSSTFTARAKVIREVQGESQVFFDDQKGFFVLNMNTSNAGTWQNLLVASQTKKFKVQVSYDPDSRQILGVTRADEANP